MISSITRILIVYAVFLSFFLMHSGGVLVFWGISVNLLLLFSVWISFLNLKTPSFFLLLCAEIFSAWLWTPFWILSFLLFPTVSILIWLVRKKLTWNRFVDYLIAISVTTIVCFVILSPYPFSAFTTPTIFFELILNIATGVLLWFSSGTLLIRHAKTTY